MYPYPYGDTEILLDVSRRGDEITLRIDKDSLGQGEYEGKPIVEIILEGCPDAEEVFEKLRESQGDGVAYQYSEKSLTLTPDFAHRFTVSCQRVSVKASDYMLSDLEKKCAWLGGNYIQLAEKYESVTQRYSSVHSRVEAEINKEIDRCQRKAEFFREMRPEKARDLSARVEAYQRLLSFLRPQAIPEPGSKPSGNPGE
jgi:hypothetical protein